MRHPGKHSIVVNQKDFVFVLNLLLSAERFIEFTDTALNRRRLSMQK